MPKVHNLADDGNAAGVPSNNDLNGDSPLADTIHDGIVRDMHQIQQRGELL